LQHFFIIKKIPVFTLPFVLVTWSIIFLFHSGYPVSPSKILSGSILIHQDFTFAFRGFGQVIFQGSIFAGIAFFIGVFINSPVSALYGISGSAMAAILSSWFSAPAEAVGMGLFSYNAVLGAIVFAGKKNGRWYLGFYFSCFVCYY
jgi:urea transporter